MFETIAAKLISGVVVLIISGIGLFSVYEHGKTVGSKEVQTKWDADKFAQAKAEAKAILQRDAENEKLKAAQDETIRLIKQGYANEKAHADSIFSAAIDSMRRDARSKSNPTQRQASTEDKNSDNSGSWTLSNAGMQDLFTVLRNADEVTADCRRYQKFITDNGMAE